MPFSKIALFFLVLSPLIYSVDNDPFRSYEVLGLASFSGVIILLNKLRGLHFRADILCVLFYSLVLVTQQSFVGNGSTAFGARYAIVMMAMFVPPFAVLTVFMYSMDVTKLLTLVMNALCVITVAMIYSSFFFDIGETYSGEGLSRAFGWLGDSFTPVIVFLILYFTLQKQWLRAFLLFGSLIMTGGKTGILMLVAAPVMYVFISQATKRKKIAILLAGAGLGAGLFYSWDAISAALLQNYEYSYNNRLLSIELGLRYFEENPWFGIGINQSMQIIGYESLAYISSEGIRAFPIEQIGNAFVRTAAEAGILGLIALIALCAIWIARSMRGLSRAYKWPVSPERSITIAGGFWILGFILFYQSTGWFEAGHPQLAWLLIISALSEAVYTRAAEQSGILSDGRSKTPGEQIENPRVAGMR